MSWSDVKASTARRQGLIGPTMPPGGSEETLRLAVILRKAAAEAVIPTSQIAWECRMPEQDLESLLNGRAQIKDVSIIGDLCSVLSLSASELLSVPIEPTCVKDLVFWDGVPEMGLVAALSISLTDRGIDSFANECLAFMKDTHAAKESLHPKTWPNRNDFAVRPSQTHLPSESEGWAWADEIGPRMKTIRQSLGIRRKDMEGVYGSHHMADAYEEGKKPVPASVLKEFCLALKRSPEEVLGMPYTPLGVEDWAWAHANEWTNVLCSLYNDLSIIDQRIMFRSLTSGVFELDLSDPSLTDLLWDFPVLSDDLAGSRRKPYEHHDIER